MEEVKNIAMCWKCRDGILVPSQGIASKFGCKKLCGCNMMAQFEWDMAVERNPDGVTPLWEDCPLSKQVE